MDGLEVEVGPLMCGEADEFLAKQAECLASSPPDLKKLEHAHYQFVCDGYNNANPDAKMTVERLRAEFDKVFIDEMLREIQAMSGLAPKGEARSPSASRN